MKSNELLINKFVDDHISDAIKILENSEPSDVCQFLFVAPIDISVDLLSQMELSLATSCIQKMDLNRIVDLFEAFSSSTSELLLRRLSPQIKNHLFEKLEGKFIDPIKIKLSYEENMVGAKMNTDILTLPHDITIDSALGMLRRSENKIFHYVCVLDRNKKLIGIAQLAELLVTDSNKPISSIVQKKFPFIDPNVQISSIAKHPGWNEHHILPVLNHDSILLGILDKNDIPVFKKVKNEEVSENFISTSNALAELFKIGLTSLLSGGRIKQQ
jgi:magnesium transporter